MVTCEFWTSPLIISPGLATDTPPLVAFFRLLKGGGICRILKKSSNYENLSKNPTVIRSKTASCWWITRHFRTVFASTWNLKYQSSTSTRFSRRGYMAQVVPSLMMTMALRHAFDIPGGEGRIQNVDESMCYTVCLIAQSGLGQFQLIHIIRKF